ncbi:DNA primase [Helicobacter sp. faydin-H20]|uniref:DNA primase n=1 Tax=Helicobacter anatolicus TaxID=2905874 RepID=UPI001E629332|nr:DNA primase [Helicobacter anatolicus]MCE3036395.1 DNA primase [Helicobacter anatolicus]
MIKQDSIEMLKQQIDIVEIIGNYVDLKKMGSVFGACCPFHNEKTPSFMVSPIKNLYHCYGCGVGGDSITFIMEIEKIGYREAIEKLAQLSNFTLEYEKNTKKKFDEEYKLFDNAKNFFKSQLVIHKHLYEYLTKRGLTKESIEKFELGYCSTSFEMIKFCDQNLLNKQKLTELGILGYNDNRYYARFNERIIFPIHSPLGKPVGFGGRSLKDNVAKYINSPQSQFFNKSKLLYGYHIAKEHIYRNEQIIITEGYLDVIMLHQAGFKTAVATLGTALTNDHFPLLNKGNPKIILSYDGDNAGIKAAHKAAFMLAMAKKEGGVVIFEGGLDPADMVQQGQIEQLQNLFNKPKPFIEFVLEQISKNFDLKNPLQKEQALKESLSFLHNLSPLLQEEYKNFIAKTLSIPLHLIPTKYKTQKQNFASKTFIPPFLEQNSHLEELIIKYILDDPNLLNFALDYIDSSVFSIHKDTFQALIDGNLMHPKIIGIQLNPKLITTPNGFQNELKILILRYNNRLLNEVSEDSTLDFTEKSFRIRKIKNSILRLKQGELIAYESFSTF